MLRLTTTTAHSDRLLHTLITADPPWHIDGVSVHRAESADTDPDTDAVAAAGPAPVSAPAAAAAPHGAAPKAVPGPHAGLAAVAAVPAREEGSAADTAAGMSTGADTSPVRRTVALMRYQAALLTRSQRWLGPAFLYAAVLAVGVRAGQPLLDSLGYTAAALLPVAAWLARLCVTQEPPAARSVVAAAVGPSRAHRASLLTALGCALVLGGAATGLVLLTGEPASTDHTVAVPLLPAALAGLSAVVCCALLGTSVGALCARPLVHRRGWSLAATLVGSLLALVTSGSPAREAVTSLVTSSLTGVVRVPALPVGVAVVVAVTAAALTSRIAALRD